MENSSMKECENCSGKGNVDIMSCNTDSNECCGGCYREVVCDECFGEGELEDFTAEDIAEELNDIIERFNVTKEDLIKIINVM
tara:strand:+ start:272 stop:520 length:249 start_codon:yes stop_codon:yes gene_type:complete